MKESIKITAPNLPPATPATSFVISIFLLSILGLGSLYLPFTQLEIPFQLKALSLLLGLLLVYGIPLALINRIRASKQYASLNSEGISINFNDIIGTLPWNEVANITTTFIVHTFKKGQNEAHPYFLITLKNPSEQIPSIPVSYRGKEIFFIARPPNYANFIGVEQDFTLALNLKNTPEVDLAAYISKYGIAFTTARPIMEVSNTQEYNTLLKDMYSSEKIAEYTLPETNTTTN